MTEKVQSMEEIRRGVIKELKKLLWEGLRRVEDLAGDDKWDQALGALSTLECVLRRAKEWR